MGTIYIGNMGKSSTIPRHAVPFRVDRPSVLGNPYPLAGEKHRDFVCDAYAEHFEQNKNSEEFQQVLQKMVEQLQNNKDIVLLCWCYPKRCHAQTIKDYLTAFITQ